jgi:uncharacterized protein YecE (DUF72 family)
MANFWIGTSGWTYDGWRGLFYPRDVAKKRWLAWYAEQFSTTEINGSFYRTPSLEAVKAWRHDTPDDFVFAWKASKFITHWKRLSEKSVNSIELMESRLKVLGPKVGPVLFQLPAHFKANRERLASFLKLLPKRYKYAFEFRDTSWYEEDILEVLGNRGVALCFSDHAAAPAPWEVTASFVYVRGHGPTGEYRDNYAPQTLRKWAEAIGKWKRRRLDVYCYFDNDQKAAAPQDARKLSELMAGKAKRRVTAR